MSAALPTRLAQLGVSIEREGGRLLLDGPEDVLTDALVAEVAAAKPSLLAVLGAGAPIGEVEETVVLGSGDVGPDSSAAKDDRALALMTAHWNRRPGDVAAVEVANVDAANGGVIGCACSAT